MTIFLAVLSTLSSDFFEFHHFFITEDISSILFDIHHNYFIFLWYNLSFFLMFYISFSPFLTSYKFSYLPKYINLHYNDIIFLNSISYNKFCLSTHMINSGIILLIFYHSYSIVGKNKYEKEF